VRFRLPRPRDLAIGLRELARRRPEEAEEYLDAHTEEWGLLAEDLPGDAADILEALEEGAAADLITGLDTVEAADVLDEMRPGAAADVLEELSPATAAELIEEMETDQAADILAELEEDVRDEILDAMSDEAAAEVSRLLAYAPDSAGGLMTTEVGVLPLGLSAGEAIEALRRLHDNLGSNISYVYVVDEEDRLRGVISFRDLVFARPGQAVEEVMVHNPVSVTADTDREVVGDLVQRYHLLAVPVTDHQQRLLGMVKVGEALEAIQEEASEDIAMMAGAGSEETVFTPVARSVRRRLPWMAFNLLGGLAVASMIGGFSETIERDAILAAYLPMVGALGGNGGGQSLAVVIRAIAVGDVTAQRARRVIRREVAIGLLNGTAIAALSAAAAYVLSGNGGVALVLGIAVFVNLIVGGLAGAGIPLLFRRIGLDPALASNIFLAMVTDIVGFGGYLFTASLLL
jgi:magnesium transporter